MNQLYSYSSCAQLPPVWPTGISIFFALDGKFPGGGDSWAVNSPGVGTKKEGKCLVTPSILQHFSLIAQSNNAVLSILCAIFRFN